MSTPAALLFALTLSTADDIEATIDLPLDGRIAGLLVFVIDEDSAAARDGFLSLVSSATGRHFAVVVATSKCVGNAHALALELDRWIDDLVIESGDVRRRHVIGVGRCGTVLASALEAGALRRFTRVGLVDVSGPVASPRSSPALFARVFVEASEENESSRETSEDLVRRLSRAGDRPVRFRYKNIPATLDAERAARFLSWFLEEADAQIAQPRIRPP